MTMIVCACCYEVEACSLYDTGPPLGYVYLCLTCLDKCPVGNCQKKELP